MPHALVFLCRVQKTKLKEEEEEAYFRGKKLDDRDEHGDDDIALELAKARAMQRAKELQDQAEAVASMQVTPISVDLGEDDDFEDIEDVEIVADDRIRLEIEEAAKKAKDETAKKRFTNEDEDPKDDDEIAQIARSQARASLFRTEEDEQGDNKAEKKKKEAKKSRKSTTKTAAKDSEKKKSKRKSSTELVS